VLIISLFVSTPLFSKAGPRDSMRKAKVEELKKLRKDLYTQKLALTKEESEKFFPIFDEYELKLREARKEFKLKWKDKKPEDLTEEEAKQYLTDATKMREKEVELFKTYSEKLKTAIPAKKIVLLPKIAKEVQKELIAKAREMKGQGGGPAGGKRGGGFKGRPGMR